MVGAALGSGGLVEFVPLSVALVVVVPLTLGVLALGDATPASSVRTSTASSAIARLKASAAVSSRQSSSSNTRRPCACRVSRRSSTPRHRRASRSVVTRATSMSAAAPPSSASSARCCEGRDSSTTNGSRPKRATTSARSQASSGQPSATTYSSVTSCALAVPVMIERPHKPHAHPTRTARHYQLRFWPVKRVPTNRDGAHTRPRTRSSTTTRRTNSFIRREGERVRDET